MRLTASLLGFEALEAAVEEIAWALPEACREGLGQSVPGLTEAARLLCPRATGALRESLEGRIEPTPAGARALVTASAPYAAFVELGTARMSPRPFLLPAYLAGRGAVLDSVAAAGGEVLGQ